MDWIFSVSGQEQVVGPCDGSNELLGSIQCEEFLAKLRTC
jgi:hypothetical protein